MSARCGTLCLFPAQRHDQYFGSLTNAFFYTEQFGYVDAYKTDTYNKNCICFVLGAFEQKYTEVFTFFVCYA